eukprot:3941135-Rhodomonas_salina.3
MKKRAKDASLGLRWTGGDGYHCRGPLSGQCSPATSCLHLPANPFHSLCCLAAWPSTALSCPHYTYSGCDAAELSTTKARGSQLQQTITLNIQGLSRARQGAFQTLSRGRRLSHCEARVRRKPGVTQPELAQPECTERPVRYMY